MKRYNFNFGIYSYYIKSELELSSDDLNKILEIIPNFPHAKRSTETINKFLEFSADKTPKHILTFTANAFDSYGNTMLGVACEYGNVDAVEKLINMGSNLDTPDDNMNKLALHWAINNQQSFRNLDSVKAVEVVKCLLENGAKTDSTCYKNMTPLQYAIDGKYRAAANLIKAHLNKCSENKSEIDASSVLTPNSLFSSANTTKPKETYCGFKPGFLIGKSI